MLNRDKRIAAFLVAAAFAIVCWIAPAQADGLPKSSLMPLGEVAKAGATSWTGFYVGAGGGYQLVEADLDNVPLDGCCHDLLNINGVSANGWLGVVRGGFDWQPSNSPFLIGLFGGYSWGQSEFSAHVGDDLVGHGTLKPTWHAGARLGYVLPNKSLLYVGAGWQQAELATKLVEPSTHTLDGKMFLAGFETPLAPTLTLSAEYNYTRYGDVTWENCEDPEIAKQTASPDAHVFMLRLNVRPFSK